MRRRRNACAMTWIKRHEPAAGNPDPQYHRGADQPLDHRRLLRAADAVRPLDVPPAAVLPHRTVRWRAMDPGDPSLDRHRAAGELCRADRAVLARQSMEP